MLTGLVAAAAATALLAIVADWDEAKPKVFYLLKPLTTILIAGIAWIAPESDYRSWLLIGLALSLAGDICLMFDGNLAFMGGLSSFLLAHVVFMWAFVHGIDIVHVPWWAGVFVLYGLVFSFVLLPKAGALKLPVLVYGTVLMGMAITASVRWVNVGGTGGLLAFIGACLFVISDSSLGARKFLGPYRGAQGLILSTYWASIALIAASALDAPA
ncbi:lysoplasmalogenase [Fontimonas sp. SYSU GA230001]|uniref:lysoplasmalogenase n=1 Tax=Fontimonas sp. SYSU GA230001 TaxID=3142450 RepID=UPI0032B6202E